MKFQSGSDVEFGDTVSFYDDVTVAGPRSGRTHFTVIDGVYGTFQQSVEMTVDTVTNFYENFNIKQKSCSGNGGCLPVPAIPDLCVTGNITAESDVIVENGDLQVNSLLPLAASTEVVIGGNWRADGVTCNTITAAEDVVATGSISGNGLASTSTITATGDINSTAGTLSPVDFSAIDFSTQDITVNNLTSTTTISTGEDISIDDNIFAYGSITSSQTIKAVGDIITDWIFIDSTP